MPNYQCSDCKKDDKTGFNYCRSCGNHLREGYAPTNLEICRQGTDRYCGNCGKPVDKCKC
jgi:hypothetical protein